MAFANWQPGMRITAERLRGSTPQAWQTWDVAWSTSTGNNTPQFGEASITAQYVHYGQMCVGRMEIFFAANTNFGAGTTSDNWQFSIPVTAAASATTAGWGEISDGSLGGRMSTRVRISGTTVFQLEVAGGRVDGAAPGGNLGLVDAQTPWIWSSDDTIRVFFEYETAA